MKILDIDNWDRKSIYEAFSKYEFPFYNVAFYLDVTRLKKYVTKHGLPFYYSMIYLATVAADMTDNFRLRIIDGKIYDIEKSAQSFTFLRPETEAFNIVSCRLTDCLDDFTAKVRNIIKHQTAFIGGEDIPQASLIYYTYIIHVCHGSRFHHYQTSTL